MATYEEIVSERGDREWQDGDDSELYDEGYKQGVRDAYDYVIDELGLDISYSNLLDRLGAS